MFQSVLNQFEKRWKYASGIDKGIFLNVKPQIQNLQGI